MKVPAPIGGLNYRDAQNRLPPTDAKTLDNWIPDSGYCRIRESGRVDADLSGVIAPECGPYSCSAYLDAVSAAGYEVLPLYRPSLLDQFDWPFAESDDDGLMEFYNFFSAAPQIQDDWGGLARRADASGWFDSSTYMDNCNGKAANVTNLTGPNTGDCALLLPNGSGIGGDWFVSAVVAPINGGTSMHRSIARCSNKRWSFTIFGSPNFASADQCGFEIISPTQVTLTIGPGNSETYTVSSLLNKWSLVSAQVSSTTPRVAANGSGFDLVTTVTVSASVNGQSFVKSGDVKFAEGVPSIENITRVDNNLYTQTRMFYSASSSQAISVMSMASGLTSEVIDLGALDVAFLRNFIGYEPPGYC